MQLSRKRKTFAEFFSAVLEFKWNFKHFEKKMILIAWPWNMWLEKSLESRVLEDPSKDNMVNGLSKWYGES